MEVLSSPYGSDLQRFRVPYSHATGSPEMKGGWSFPKMHRPISALIGSHSTALLGESISAYLLQPLTRSGRFKMREIARDDLVLGVGAPPLSRTCPWDFCDGAIR